MFTMKQSMATAGVVTTVGATFALGTFGAAPATGAQLDFDFSTTNGKTGSFTLNTSTLDSEPGIDSGIFQNAITNFEYSGVGFSAPLGVRTSTPNPGPRTSFYVSAFEGNTQDVLFYFNLDFSDLSLVNDLSDDPADYSLSSVNGSFGAFAGYGGGFEGSESEQSQYGYLYSPVTSVTVVPEPLTIIGSGMAIGFGALLQRKYSKKPKKI